MRRSRLGDVHVNLIDTPGHPDFIAEVERVLNVLDGAVLVISAVEGVQPQTRILMRALQRLHIPTLVFVNKIDRPGADAERVLRAITERLTQRFRWDRTRSARARSSRATHGFRLGWPRCSRNATTGSWRRTSRTRPRAAPPAQDVARGADGAGARAPGLLRLRRHRRGRGAVAGRDHRPAAGRRGRPRTARSPGAVFKIERGAGGEKIAYVRMFSGTIRVRDRLQFGRGLDAKVTAIAVFERGPAVQRPAVSAGEVAKLWGLADIQIGDRIGELATGGADHHFAAADAGVGRRRGQARRPPAAPRRARAARRAGPADQRPAGRHRQELSVSLYGEVQKEVIQATLANDFGLEVTFRETTPIYIERPIGTGEAIELLHADSNPYLATIGLRIDPAPEGFGIDFRLQVDLERPAVRLQDARRFRGAQYATDEVNNNSGDVLLSFATCRVEVQRDP